MANLAIFNPPELGKNLAKKTRRQNIFLRLNSGSRYHQRVKKNCAENYYFDR